LLGEASPKPTLDPSTAKLPADVTVETPSTPDGPKVVKMRAELRFDKTLNRVVGRILDEETGEEIRKVPPEELLQLYAKTREMLGPLVDEKV
jgi:hypothetical protein